MRAVVNDISFQIRMPDRQTALDVIHQFLLVCREMESGRCHAVEKLLVPEIKREGEIYPGANLYHLINEIDPDFRRYMLGLLLNREVVPDDGALFRWGAYASRACAMAKDGVMISLASALEFQQDTIAGTIDSADVEIPNISNEGHMWEYRKLLGKRIYKAHSVKHKKDRENAYGKGRVASVMDLGDEEAQQLLDKAIPIGRKLYAKRGGRYYTFLKTEDVIYHGFRDDDPGESIMKTVDRVFDSSGR